MSGLRARRTDRVAPLFPADCGDRIAWQSLRVLLLKLGQCARNHGSRRRGDRTGTTQGVVQQHPQRLQRTQCRSRRFGEPHWSADRSIEHPGRKLQIPTDGLLGQGAAEDIRATLSDYLVNANNSPRPGMPEIRDLLFLNPVGVLSCRSTRGAGRIAKHRTGNQAAVVSLLPDPGVRLFLRIVAKKRWCDIVLLQTRVSSGQTG